MKALLLVALGGCLGTIARYKMGGWIVHRTADWQFPLSTFVVNTTGCLVAGALWGIAERYDLFSLNQRVFIFSGLLGGFTTFSAFSAETIFLLRRGEISIAFLNVGLSVLVGLLAVWAGMKLFLSGRS